MSEEKDGRETADEVIRSVRLKLSIQLPHTSKWRFWEDKDKTWKRKIRDIFDYLQYSGCKVEKYETLNSSMFLTCVYTGNYASYRYLVLKRTGAYGFKKLNEELI